MVLSDARGDGAIPKDMVMRCAKELDVDPDIMDRCMERLRILTYNRKVRRLAGVHAVLGSEISNGRFIEGVSAEKS